MRHRARIAHQGGRDGGPFFRAARVSWNARAHRSTTGRNRDVQLRCVTTVGIFVESGDRPRRTPCIEAARMLAQVLEVERLERHADVAKLRVHPHRDAHELADATRIASETKRILSMELNVKGLRMGNVAFTRRPCWDGSSSSSRRGSRASRF